jgi:hypothetical protein
MDKTKLYANIFDLRFVLKRKKGTEVACCCSCCARQNDIMKLYNNRRMRMGFSVI